MRIADKLAAQDWCREELRQLQEELDRVLAGQAGPSEAAAALEPPIPTEPGGWWHQYVCPEHHTELLFDPLEEDAHAYRCPYGCVVEGPEYRGAWLVFRHQAWARYALQAAAVYAGTGEAVYAELGRRIIVRYARLFPDYPVHPEAQPWMLKGRAFHQALTEAIWATTLLRAYVMLADEGVDFGGERAALDSFFGMLESSMREYHGILVHERKEPANNYTAWLIAALASVYAARGERQRMAELVACEGGFRHHLGIAVQPDQLEFEGSIYYHVFVLRAYFITAEMAERCGIGLYDAVGAEGQSLQGMCDVLVTLADGGGRLPALHDGPYDRVPYAREIAEVLEIGHARFGRREYEPLLADAYRQLSGRPLRSGLEAVVYGSGGRELALEKLTPASGLLPQSGWAILSHPANELSCLVDYGPHGGSHGHYDKLNLMIGRGCLPVAPDRGTVPYGSPLKKGWYPHTACHNTVTVGGRSQSAAAGRLQKLDVSDSRAYAWLETDEAYPGCRLARHVIVTAGWVLDWYEVELAQPQQIDWWFHYVGVAAQDDALEDATAARAAVKEGAPVHPPIGRLAQWQPRTGPLGTEDGYAYIRPVGEWTGDDGDHGATVMPSEPAGGERREPSSTAVALCIAAPHADRHPADGRREDGSARTAGVAAAGESGAAAGPGDADLSGAAGEVEAAGGSGAAALSGTAGGTQRSLLHLLLLPEAGTEVIRVQSPGLATDPSRMMEGILMRSRSAAARFIAVYSAGAAQPQLQQDAQDPGKVVIELDGERRSYRMTADGLEEG
ncbi:heparinase II/III family protein [Paenibacillus sp. 1P07SE]|uniref:heparinase II/III domain-containing protein n=1 Tax=Paenibacillus sp. 1P07SE TaxID=3132209 RepID=UPI0039A42B97